MNRSSQQTTRSQRSSSVRRAFSPDEVRQDAELETALVLMLSNLESSRARLQSPSGRGARAESAAAIVDQVAVFARARFDGEFLAEALAEIGDVHARAAELHRQAQSGRGGFLGLFRKAPEDDSKEFALLMRDEVVALESVFALFATRFHAPAAANEWSQAYRLFLADLAAVAESVGKR